MSMSFDAAYTSIIRNLCERLQNLGDVLGARARLDLLILF